MQNVTQGCLIFSLNEVDNTASIVKCTNTSNDVFIPRSIIHDSKEFVITSINQYALYNSNIKSITFSSDSQLQTISMKAFSQAKIESISIPPTKVEFQPNSILESLGEEIFNGSKIESLTIPSCVSEFKKMWSCGLMYLKTINIFQSGKENIMYFKNKIVLSKSDPKSDIFDEILLSRRNIKTVTVPPYITRISDRAFNRCNDLTRVNFPSNSELKTIGEFAFSYSNSIERISIPSSVTYIGKGCFLSSKKFKIVDFSEHSELRSIEDELFNYSSISSIFIPPKVEAISSHAFNFCKNLEIIEINEIFKIQKENILNIENKNAIIMVPAVIKNVFE